MNEYVINTFIKLSVIIKSDYHEGYIVAILIWLKWPKWLKSVGPLSLLNPNGPR
jgi:hypothetical protein